MNNASTPDDELISSYLDGEATPAEAARIESDAIWLARASELREAAALTANPVRPVDPDVIDQMIAAAIDAGKVPSNVTDLAAAKRSRAPQVLAAAAAVVMLALAVPLIRSINGSSGGSDSAATSFEAADAEPAATTAALDQPLAESALSPKSVSPTTTEAASSADAGSSRLADEPASSGNSRLAGLPPVDISLFNPLPPRLGDVADVPGLRTELAALFAASELQATQPQPDFSPQCLNSLDEFASERSLLAFPAMPEAFTDLGLVSINGTTNLVALIQLEPGRAVALLVDATECSNVSEIDIAP